MNSPTIDPTDHILGIDLGTTHSLVAFHDGKQTTIVQDANGQRLIPSILYAVPGGDIKVGQPSEQELVDAKGKMVFVSSVKRLMGRSYEDVRRELKHYPFAIRPREDGSIVEVQLGDHWLTPQEVAARVLIHLKRVAQDQAGLQGEKAVITVPAYFDDAQRHATKDAAKIAGIHVVRMINEPTAAALAYGLNRRNEGRVAVYDLGGGTFDVSILKIKDGIFKVLSTAGDTFLGGDDFDNAIADLIAEEITKKHFIRLDDQPQLLNTILQASRRLKHKLTSSFSGVIDIRLAQFSETYRKEMSRDEFDALIETLVGKTIASCERALRQAELKAEDIDAVVMVGGSSRVPHVRDRVGKIFAKELYTDLNPDEVVAMGAAIQAHALQTNADAMLLLDVCPLSLGIETAGGSVSKLIVANSSIPTEVMEEFSTSKDNQTGVTIHVVQGERELVKDNRSLARFVLKGIPPMPAGLPRIQVTFALDANGILTVTAHELRSDTKASIDVVPSNGLSKDQVDRMIIESVESAEEDFTKRLLIDKKEHARLILVACERTLKEHGNAISAEEATTLRATMKRVEAALDAITVEQLQSHLEQLQAISVPIAEKVMSTALTEALRGQAKDESGRTLADA